MSAAFLRKRYVLLVAAGVLILGASVWAVVALSKGEESALPQQLADALKADSNDPGKLRERVHEAMSRGDLTEQQRHELWENVHSAMEAQMEKRLDEYFAASESQRQAILDRQLDEMQAEMRQRQQRRAPSERDGSHREGDHRPPAGPSAGPPGGDHGPPAGPEGRPNDGSHDRHAGSPTREQRKLRSESRDPDQRARRMAYFAAMRKRAAERGISLPGPGGRMGGGPH